MPRRKMKLREKVRVFFIWMREYANVSLLLTCGRCDSIDIQLIESEQDEYLEKISRYRGKYYCRSCNAIGSCTQAWSDLEGSEANG